MFSLRDTIQDIENNELLSLLPDVGEEVVKTANVVIYTRLYETSLNDFTSTLGNKTIVSNHKYMLINCMSAQKMDNEIMMMAMRCAFPR